MQEKDFNLWKLLEVIALKMRFILIFVLVVTVISIIVSLLLPKWYEASALLMPPKEEGFNLGWGDEAGDFFSLTSGIRLPIMATPSDVYARILGSRQLTERVIERNDLQQYYDIASIDDAVLLVASRSRFRVTPEGLLEIAYQDRDRKTAAQVANSFADELGKFTRELAASRARLTKEFIAGRLEEVSRELDSARSALQEFQNEYKAIDLDRQTQLAIEAAIGLKVQLAQTEIDLNVKEKTLSANHPEVVSLQRRISEIRKQIRGLEFGGTDSSYLNLPISEVPRLKIRYAEITSRLRVSEALYQILSEQYEQAKIQEKMITPTISVLDRAYPPDLAIKPQKRVIVVVTFIVALILAIFLALFLNYLENLKRDSPEEFARIAFFYNTLLSWLPGVKKMARISE
jgi:uncharacterized protein involved in exopolysaccharide biosynthesis